MVGGHVIALSPRECLWMPYSHQFTRSNLFLAICYFYYLIFVGLLKFEIPVSPDSRGYDNVERDLFLRSWHHEAGRRHFTKI